LSVAALIASFGGVVTQSNVVPRGTNFLVAVRDTGRSGGEGDASRAGVMPVTVEALAFAGREAGVAEEASRLRNAAMSSARRAGLNPRFSTDGHRRSTVAYADVTSGQRRRTMPEYKIGTREEWQAARDELAKLEAEHAELGQRVTEQRRQLPWVPVEKEYRFDTEDGKKTLAELFDGRSQLLAYNIMFGPDYELVF
jgi:hypothetical protein